MNTLQEDFSSNILRTPFIGSRQTTTVFEHVVLANETSVSYSSTSFLVLRFFYQSSALSPTSRPTRFLRLYNTLMPVELWSFLVLLGLFSNGISKSCVPRLPF